MVQRKPWSPQLCRSPLSNAKQEINVAPRCACLWAWLSVCVSRHLWLPQYLSAKRESVCVCVCGTTGYRQSRARESKAVPLLFPAAFLISNQCRRWVEQESWSVLLTTKPQLGWSINSNTRCWLSLVSKKTRLLGRKVEKVKLFWQQVKQTPVVGSLAFSLVRAEAIWKYVNVTSPVKLLHIYAQVLGFPIYSRLALIKKNPVHTGLLCSAILAPF